MRRVLADANATVPYEDVFKKGKKKWHIIPADKHWYRDYVVSDIVCRILEKMNPRFPTLRGIRK